MNRSIACELVVAIVLFAPMVVKASQNVDVGPDANGLNGNGPVASDSVSGVAPPNGFVEPKPGDRPVNPLGGWYLGVYGNYTPTGLLLTQVHPGTAAAKSGLEIGDRIAAVNGLRIGVHMPLSVALQRTSHGWVRLLVQDRRTGRWVNVNVRLTRGRVHT